MFLVAISFSTITTILLNYNIKNNNDVQYTHYTAVTQQSVPKVSNVTTAPHAHATVCIT